MMADIAEVIGWKFNHQPGMCTKDGVITEFPGGIPSQADQDIWTAEYEAYLPAKQWEEDMADSDAILPRWAEDMLDAMNASDFANVDQMTKDKLTAKKNMRSQKPE